MAGRLGSRRIPRRKRLPWWRSPDGTVYAFVLGTGLVRAREPELAWQTIGNGLPKLHA